MAERIVATMGDDVDQSRRRARNLSRPSGANSTKVQVPTNLKHGAEVGEWLDNHPEAQAEILAKVAREGGVGY